MKTVFFIHLLDWNSTEEIIKLSKSLSLCKSEGTKELKAYHKLCFNKNIHDGEPLNFNTHILVDDDESYRYYSYENPSLDIARICSVISILTRFPIESCFVIQSADDFETIYWFNEYYQSREIYDYLYALRTEYKELDFSRVKYFWDQFNTLYYLESKENRLNPAFNSFYFSWRSISLTQMCVNLAITLEALFSPFSQNELSHQIAFNACHFLGNNPKEKEELYKLFKTFYSIRYKIVHGSKVKDNELKKTVPKTFILICEIFEMILNDNMNIEIFTNKEIRDKEFSKWLFR